MACPKIMFPFRHSIEHLLGSDVEGVIGQRCKASDGFKCAVKSKCENVCDTLTAQVHGQCPARKA